MPKGQKPKPIAIKKAEGNRSKVAKADLEDFVEGKGSPRVPMHLSAMERQLWAHIVQSLPDGLLSRADEMMLEKVAIYWARFRDVQRQIVATGLLIHSAQGAVRNPLLVVQNQCARELQAACSELGLSPVARARMTSFAAETDDPMELLLGGEEEGAWATAPRGRAN